MKSVQEFYNRFPYPPVPALALPRAGQADRIAYETGATFAGLDSKDHRGKRILVAGAGTLEAVVIAQQHPRAKEVVALDLSDASLKRLRTRYKIAKARSIFPGLGIFNRLAPIKTRCSDILEFEDSGFDYITATLVLHHHEDPIALLQKLSSMLNPNGILRLTTYPKHSRFWTRQIGSWIKNGGIDRAQSALKTKCDLRIQELDAKHPIRVSYEDNPESQTATGIADCYLHPCENPLTPLEWAQAARGQKLQLVGESQHPYAQSSFLDDLVPALKSLSAWEKLQTLDDLLELSSNPVLWLHKSDHLAPPLGPSIPSMEVDLIAPPGQGIALTKSTNVEDILSALRDAPETRFWLPSRPQFELASGIRRCLPTLLHAELSLQDILKRITDEVGPRVSIHSHKTILKGLTLPELLQEESMGLPEPSDSSLWSSLANKAPELELRRVDRPEKRLPGKTIKEQAENLHLNEGCQLAWIGPFLLRDAS